MTALVLPVILLSMVYGPTTLNAMDRVSAPGMAIVAKSKVSPQRTQMRRPFVITHPLSYRKTFVAN